MSSRAAAIELTPEQGMLADIARQLARDRCSLDATRELLDTADGFDRELWSDLVEAGWPSLAIPEAHGGTALGAVELVTAVEPLARRLCPTPLVPTQLAVAALVGAGEAATDLAAHWLPRIAAGTIGTVAVLEEGGGWDLESCSCTASFDGETVALSGGKTLCLDLEVADLVVVSVRADDEPALLFLDREQIPPAARQRQVVIDETRRSYRLALDGIVADRDQVVTGPAALRALGALRDTGLLLTSAEACGGLAGTLDLIVGYLGEREQFGRKIGSYQALKHPTVEILVGLERARSHLYHAATVFGGDAAEVALRMAKAAASDAFAFAADRAVQFHGGFGFTYECNAQLFLRRALWCQVQFGDAPYQRQLLAESLL